MEDLSLVRAYDRLLQTAAEQMAALPPRPDLARAAQAAGIPLPEARRMFEDDDALGMAVMQQQLLQLTDYLGRQAAAAPADDVIAQLRAIGHAYLEWCFEHRVGGRLLTSANAMTYASEAEVARFSEAIYDLCGSMMERARKAGLVPQDLDISCILLTTRALVLGIVALHEMDQTRYWGKDADPKAALMRVFDEYFNLALRQPG